MQDGNSLISLGELSKPVNTLIEKISDAIGGIFLPQQIKRTAKAEAEASKIKAIAAAESSKIAAMSDIEIKEIQQRALYRFVAEETKKQINMESIAQKSIKDINDDAKPENMEDDWISNFFNKCKFISDAEMQTLWAKVLAGEANNPGSYSKRTLEFLSTMDKNDAMMFQNLCSFKWFVNYIVILVFNTEDEIYINNGINFNNLKHLDSIGLINFESISNYNQLKFGEIINSSYFTTPIVLKFNKKEDNEISIGQVILTKIGRELLKIVDPKPIPNFIDHVLDNFRKQKIITYSYYPKLEVPVNTIYGVGTVKS